MPEKLDIYRSYGDKIISLFARLLFSGESYSLTELSRMLGCSKQTVLRLVDNIRKAFGIEIDETFQGKRKYYRIRRPGKALPPVTLSDLEMNVLMMCRAFAEQLLGRELFEEATRGLEKSMALLPGRGGASFRHFASFRPGSIDYTPHHEVIRKLIEAMEKNRVCRISYKAPPAERAKSFSIKPLKIFSYHETLYLHARKAMEPGTRYRALEYDPLLAIHRIREVEVTERPFEFPKHYDFEKVFNLQFGIIKDEAFKVTVEFTGFAAVYVAERVWSPDQKIVKTGEEGIKLTFSASSEPELIAWVLWFGDEAKVLKPKWLVKRVRDTIKRMEAVYELPSSEPGMGNGFSKDVGRPLL